MAPGQETSLAPPCSNLSSFGSKFPVLKKVPVTLLGLVCTPAVIRRLPQWFGALIVSWRPGNCAPLPPLFTPLLARHLNVETPRSARCTSGKANGKSARWETWKPHGNLTTPWASDWKLEHHFTYWKRTRTGQESQTIFFGCWWNLFDYKRRVSSTSEPAYGRKLFCSGVDPAQFVQAGLVMLVTPQLASCVDKWIP